MIIIQRIEVIIVVFFAGLTKTKLLLAGSRPILQLTVTCQPNSYRQLPVKQQLSVAGPTAAVSCRSNSCCQWPVKKPLSVASQTAAAGGQLNSCCQLLAKQLPPVASQTAAASCWSNSCHRLPVRCNAAGCRSHHPNRRRCCPPRTRARSWWTRLASPAEGQRYSEQYPHLRSGTGA